jgi:hypothetical protein
VAFVNITYNEVVFFLKRAFRALDPKPGPIVRGELTYTLKLNPRPNSTDANVQNYYIVVFTSVHEGKQDAAAVGSDAIRVGPMTTDFRPIRRGKFPIVKRTNSWKDSLREAIEDLILEYDHDSTMGR